MSSLHLQGPRGRRRPVVFIDPENLLRPEELVAGNTPGETAGAAYSLRLGQIHLALPQGIFGSFALGDVLACDEDDQLVSRPTHGFGSFTNPEDRPVLA